MWQQSRHHLDLQLDGIDYEARTHILVGEKKVTIHYPIYVPSHFPKTLN